MNIKALKTRMLVVKKVALLLVITILFFVSGPNHAQVGGISGSKISAYTVDVVDHHTVEFEPAFHHLRSAKFWDDEGVLNDLAMSGDSIKFTTGLDFRVTYGITDKLEIGNTFSSDLLLTRIGMRYVFFDHSYAGLAVIGGINIPLGNRTVSKTFRRISEALNAGGGLVFTTYITPDLSFDLNAQYLRGLRETDDRRLYDLFLNGDFGYYLFSHQFQLIAGFGYQKSHFENGETQLFTIYPGITVETGKNYIIVLNSIIDLWGKNIEKSVGLALALTITIE